VPSQSPDATDPLQIIADPARSRERWRGSWGVLKATRDLDIGNVWKFEETENDENGLSRWVSWLNQWDFWYLQLQPLFFCDSLDFHIRCSKFGEYGSDHVQLLFGHHLEAAHPSFHEVEMNRSQRVGRDAWGGSGWDHDTVVYHDASIVCPGGKWFLSVDYSRSFLECGSHATMYTCSLFVVESYLLAG
jgi:hypothetical protein